jgi:phosphoglycerate dehydrogenase-like enzyme
VISPPRIVAAQHPSQLLPELVAHAAPGAELVIDHAVLGPPPSAVRGPQAPFHRGPAAQARYEELLLSADIVLGLPDGGPEALARLVRSSERLRWLHTFAAGGGAQIRRARLAPQDLARITFTTSAGVHARPLAEFCLFGLLAGAKDLPRLQSLATERTWATQWEMRQLHQQTILVLGLGGIGRETARLVGALGARVIGVKRRPRPVAHVDEVHGIEDLPALVGRADGIVIALPSTPFTDGLYSRELIAATKPGAVLVNVGRGTVVDEQAMIEALASGHLHSAFLDVTAIEPLPPESPLWSMPQVVVSPHIAADDAGEDDRIAMLFTRNLQRWLAGEAMDNVVDVVHFY